MSSRTPRPGPPLLTDQQQAAIEAVSGPVVIHAGAGTGKTTVIAQRTARAAATGAMDPARALLLTFTDRAAGEMAERVAALGVPGVTAMTFHKAAWRQLRYFWPLAGGADLTILSQPWRLVSPMIRRLPGHYRFTPTADVLDAISWIKNARLQSGEVEAVAEQSGRTLPLPPDLLMGVVRRYEQRKDDDGLVDFDDMILRLTDLLADRPDFAEQVRQRYAWFSVDEFQDTNPAQFDLLRTWLGDGLDVGVVGDEHQTIYSFAGATSEYLRDFGRWFPTARSFDLTVNHRSTGQILDLANRLLPDALGLTATRPDGPTPLVEEFADEHTELDNIVARLTGWNEAGIAWAEAAVLVRLNADIPPLEAAFTRAEIPYQVRGTAFFERRDVREAERLLAALPGNDLMVEFVTALTSRMGYDPTEEPATPEARERQAALATLLDIVRATAADGLEAVLADLARRRGAESDASGNGVTIATLHRAKGLEWDAVILPGLEQGHLPVKQAAKSPEQLAEERRLLYVGITRARRELRLSWVRERAGKRQTRSAFLDALAPRPARSVGRVRTKPRSVDAVAAALADGDAGSLYDRLKAWRLEVARAEQVPAYVVFSNSTLALIARDRPTTRDQLAGISGVGPAKLERYADDVLAVVAAQVD